MKASEGMLKETVQHNETNCFITVFNVKHIKNKRLDATDFFAEWNFHNN